MRGARRLRDTPSSTTTEPADAPHARRNRFQVRYVVRHPWEGELACASPVRGVWGAPMHELPPDPVGAARDAAALDAAALDAALVASLEAVGLGLPPDEEHDHDRRHDHDRHDDRGPVPGHDRATSSSTTGCGCRAGRSDGPCSLATFVALVVGSRRQRS